MLDRIVIDDVRPRTPTGRYPAKAVIGEPTVVSATVFKDGHDLLAGRVCWRPVATGRAKPKSWAEAAMSIDNRGLDHWIATIEPIQLGLHEFVVEAWFDEWATIKHKLKAKLDAGQEVEVELEELARLIEHRAVAHGPRTDQSGRAGTADQAVPCPGVRFRTERGQRACGLRSRTGYGCLGQVRRGDQHRGA